MRRHSHLLSLALAAALSYSAGCEEDGYKRGGSSSKTGAAAPTTVGGRKPAKEILVGTWKMEVTVDDAKAADALRKYAAARKKAMSEAEIKQGVERMKQTVGALSFTVTFNADGTSTARRPQGPLGKEQVAPGTWEIISEDGASLTLKVTDQTGPDKGKPDEIQLVIEDDRTLRVVAMKTMKDIPGTMRFRKQ